MPNRRVTIKAVDAVKCIRSGMDDAALMQEFNVVCQRPPKPFYSVGSRRHT